MEKDSALKTTIFTVVTLLHLGGIYALMQHKKAPEIATIEDSITFVDLGSADGNNIAATDGAPALPPPPKVETPPPPPKPKEPPKIPPKKIKEKEAVEPPVKAVIKENKPADLAMTKKEPEKMPPKPKPEKKEIKPEIKPEVKPEVKEVKKEIKPEIKPEIKETKDTKETKEVKEVKETKSSDKPTSASTSQANANQANNSHASKGANVSADKGRADGGGGNNPHSSAPNNGKGAENGKNEGKGRKGDDNDDGERKSAATGIADGGYLERPAPPYPIEALGREEEGTVHLSVLVLPDGSVDKVSKIKSSGSISLDRAAEKAARSARYKPKSSGGTPLRTRFTVVYSFSLSHQ